MKRTNNWMGKGQTLIVKFLTPGEPEKEAEHIRTVLGQHVVIDTAPLFPGETSGELACLYTVNLAGDTQVENVIETLTADPEVEYAHLPESRSLL